MGSVEIAYSRSYTIGSAVIRAATWSGWSHNALVMPDGISTIEAAWPRGVQYGSLGALERRSSKVRVIRIDGVPNPAAVYRFAEQQVGRPYDTWGVLGLGLRREWDDPESWWCSELIEAALAAGGRQRFATHAHRVTPQHSWMVL